MRKLTLIFLLISFLSSITACAPSNGETAKRTIKGKFVFQGVRKGGGRKFWATYLSENGIVKKISDDVGYSAWSPDGSQFAVTSPDDKRVSFFDSDGQLLSTLKTSFIPGAVCWFPDGKKIAYVDEQATKGVLADTFHLMVYNVESKEQDKILSLENDQCIFNLFISPDNKKIVLTIASVVNPEVKNRLAVLNIEKKSLIDSVPNASAIGWFPDGVHIAVETNTMPDGKWIGSPHGVLAKINAETGEFIIIKEQNYEAIDMKLSRDGKYTVYSNSLPSGGVAIFVRSIETDEVFQITKPIQIGSDNFSRDSFPDWHQESTPDKHV